MFGIFYYALGRNENFYFLPFTSIFQPILALNKAIWYFLIFWTFLLFFLEFSITRWVRAKRNENFYFPPFTSIFQPILALNEAIMAFFNFLNFFAIFLEFSISLWVKTKRNDNIYFLHFSDFSNLFWLEMKPYNSIF